MPRRWLRYWKNSWLSLVRGLSTRISREYIPTYWAPDSQHVPDSNPIEGRWVNKTLIQEQRTRRTCTLMNLWGLQANLTKDWISLGNVSQIEALDWLGTATLQLAGLSPISKWAAIEILTTSSWVFAIHNAFRAPRPRPIKNGGKFHWPLANYVLILKGCPLPDRAALNSRGRYWFDIRRFLIY